MKGSLIALSAMGVLLFGFLLYSLATRPGQPHPEPPLDVADVTGDAGPPDSPVEPNEVLVAQTIDGAAPQRESSQKIRDDLAARLRRLGEGSGRRLAGTPQLEQQGVSEAGARAPTPSASPSVAPAQPMGERSAASLFAAASPAVVRVVVRDDRFAVIGQGSGFFVSADGLLVTNHHVIEGASFASVQFADGATLFVDGVVAFDANADLAILQVNGKGLPFLRLADTAPPVGATVYALGNPEGLTNTLSEGIISAHRTSDGRLSALQTTAPISRGSSGGPLLAEDGTVVGVTTSFLSRGQNLNFAVPTAAVHSLASRQGAAQALASAGGTRLDRQATVRLGEAWAAMARGDHAKATTLLTELVRVVPEDPWVWVALAALHKELGDWDQAVQHYNAALALNADLGVAYRGLGDAYLHLQRYERGIAAYRKYLCLDSATVLACVDIARRCAQAHVHVCQARSANAGGDTEWTEAVLLEASKAAYRRSTRFPCNHPNDCAVVAGAYAELGEGEAALQVCVKGLKTYPKSAVLYSTLARIYRLHLNQTDRAVTVYKKGLRECPQDWGLFSALIALYQDLRRPKEALEVCRQAVRVLPDQVQVRKKCAAICEQLSLWDDAGAEYQAVIAIAPNDVAAYRGFAGACANTGRHAGAVAALRHVVALEGESYWDRYTIAELCMEGRMYRDALEEFRAALRACTDPRDAPSVLRDMAYLGLGDAWRALREYPRAIDAYQRAAKAGKARRALTELVDVYMTLGRREDALAAYRELLRVGGTGDVIQRARSRLGLPALPAEDASE